MSAPLPQIDLAAAGPECRPAGAALSPVNASPSGGGAATHSAWAAVLRDVEARHGLTREQMRTRRRLPALVAARREACVALRALSPRPSLTRIAQLLGYQNHTTVLQHLKRCADGWGGLEITREGQA